MRETRKAPPVPPRVSKNLNQIRFREILPGELPFAEMVGADFDRLHNDD